MRSPVFVTPRSKNQVFSVTQTLNSIKEEFVGHCVKLILNMKKLGNFK